ncbi:histidine kinase [Nocardia sp. NPDC048505]|uniref:sensor histidine kinase n=1 Tax=Nocardia sp. NPDC048505 TaxID=3155756 RepID=UPI0033C90143
MKYGALLAITAAGGVLNGLGMEGLPPWRQLLFAALFLAAYLQGRRVPMERGGPVLVVAFGAAAAIAAVDVAESISAGMTLALFVALPWVIGRYRRQQAELLAAGTDRIAQLERTQTLTAESARLRERARIATDMHDALGHELALIAVQAGALELGATLDEPTRESARRLREAAVTASDELRRTIGLLRTDTRTEPPSLSVDALIARARSAGMTVELHQPTTHPLPHPAEQALRRLIQETLTNAARHAPGQPVHIRFEPHPNHLTVIVTNPHATPTPTTAEARSHGSNGSWTPLVGAAESSAGGGRVPLVGVVESRSAGTGLIGLAERVELLGGTFRAESGGSDFIVTAGIPLRPVVVGS